MRYPLAAFLVGLTLFSTGLVAQERPNVILILTDDQGYGDLGATGNPIIRTPHLDAMARRSATINSFYVEPVCSPTRASIMTGRYHYRTRVVDTWKGRS
ncbi:MAG: sulfatase-like hydrolase/transferase, partial [Planctomycetota bacterium]